LRRDRPIGSAPIVDIPLSPVPSFVAARGFFVHVALNRDRVTD
jgi:hypothetical protein